MMLAATDENQTAAAVNVATASDKAPEPGSLDGDAASTGSGCRTKSSSNAGTNKTHQQASKTPTKKKRVIRVIRTTSLDCNDNLDPDVQEAVRKWKSDHVRRDVDRDDDLEGCISSSFHGDTPLAKGQRRISIVRVPSSVSKEEGETTNRGRNQSRSGDDLNAIVRRSLSCGRQGKNSNTKVTVKRPSRSLSRNRKAPIQSTNVPSDSKKSSTACPTSPATRRRKLVRRVRPKSPGGDSDKNTASELPAITKSTEDQLAVLQPQNDSFPTSPTARTTKVVRRVRPKSPAVASDADASDKHVEAAASSALAEAMKAPPLDSEPGGNACAKSPATRRRKVVRRILPKSPAAIVNSATEVATTRPPALTEAVEAPPLVTEPGGDVRPKSPATKTRKVVRRVRPKSPAVSSTKQGVATPLPALTQAVNAPPLHDSEPEYSLERSDALRPPSGERRSRSRVRRPAGHAGGRSNTGSRVRRPSAAKRSNSETAGEGDSQASSNTTADTTKPSCRSRVPRKTTKTLDTDEKETLTRVPADDVWSGRMGDARPSRRHSVGAQLPAKSVEETTASTSATPSNARTARRHSVGPTPRGRRIRSRVQRPGAGKSRTLASVASPYRSPRTIRKKVLASPRRANNDAAVATTSKATSDLEQENGSLSTEPSLTPSTISSSTKSTTTAMGDGAEEASNSTKDSEDVGISHDEFQKLRERFQPSS